MKKNQKKFSIIKWEDHWSGYLEWTSYDDMQEICSNHPIITSIGFIVHEDAKSISLAGTCSDNEVSLIMTILKKCIVQRTDYKLKDFI